jgi:hypothetical protein
MNTRKLLNRFFGKKRHAVGGWVIAVVFLGLIVFAFIMTPINFLQNSINTWTSVQPGFTASYDPSTNTFMDLLLSAGLAIMVAFGAIIEIVNVTQKRTSGEEVI